MKRLLSLLFVLVCMMTLFGCGKEPGEGLVDEKGQAYFNAIVLESNEGSVKVKCTEAFDSEIMESYPLKLGTVFAIYLLDENGEVIPND